MDLRSIAEQVFEDLSLSECTTDTETGCTESPRSSVLSLYFHITSTEDGSLFELFKQTLDWFDPDSDLFVTCKSKGNRRANDKPQQSTLDIQSLALVLCLQETGHLQQAQQFFSCRPWKFHHKEWIGTQSHGYSDCQDYYTLTMDRPLCSVRKISSGVEHLQILRYVSSKHWKDTINLYKLILSTDLPTIKRDMCIFIIEQYSDYEVQLCLKKLPKGISPKKTRKTELCFQVSDIGSLVPLFPNVCHKVSDVRWCTKDLDGNRIYLQVPKSPCRCTSTGVHGYPKKSAFSPVVPNKIKSHDTLQDKFSPRVYQCNGSVKGRPPLPSKVAKEERKDCRKKIIPSTTRNRPLSANSIPVSEVTNIRACTSQNIVRSRPSSANSVLISTAQCFHSHTDSGFVDSSMDSSYLKDPRRTPIIGTHLSNLTQYERFISTPNSSFGQYDELKSPTSTYSSDSVFDMHCQQHRKYSSLDNLHSDYSKMWVEHYVADQNKLLGLERDYESNDNNYEETNDYRMHTIGKSSKSENKHHLDSAKIESVNELKKEYIPEINESGKTDETVSINSEGSSEVTPRAVNVEDHNLDEYINLVWSSQNKNIASNSADTTDNKNFNVESNVISENSSKLISNLQINQDESKHIPLINKRIDNSDESNNLDKVISEENEKHISLTNIISPSNAKDLKSNTTDDLMQKKVEASLNSPKPSSNKPCPPPLLPKPMIKPLSNITLRTSTTNFTNQSSEISSIPRINSDSSLQSSQFNDNQRKSSFDLGNAIKQFKAVHNGYDLEMPIDVVLQPDTNKTGTNQTTHTHTSQNDQNPITLGEFFDSNKMFSKFLEKRTVAHLPDVVQVQEPAVNNYIAGTNIDEHKNDITQTWHVNRSKIDRFITPVSLSKNEGFTQEAGTHMREGSPDDETCSDTNTSDENRKSGKKRVTFSEVNSKHEYEAMDWNEDILPHDDVIHLSEDNISDSSKESLLVTEQPFLKVDYKQTNRDNLSNTRTNGQENRVECQSIRTDTATAEDINKFYNQPIKLKDLGMRENHTCSTQLDSSYSQEDWENIKQKPQHGFYI